MSTFLSLFLALISFSVWSQEFKYKLEGSFSTAASETTLEPVIVNYTINWNETSSALQGTYQDNYFSREEPHMVAGTVSTDGRAFSVIFPNEVNDVKSISINTVEVGKSSGSIPVTIVTRDNVGRPIDAPNTFAFMETRTIIDENAPQDNSTCSIGFGALTGYCGLYKGTFYEISDTRDRCNLSSSGEPRLEFATDTSFNFIPNYIVGATDLAKHRIGTFLPTPQSSTINISSSVCRSLPATVFVPNNCKTLNLSGVFFEQITTILFTGTYTITDEQNGDFCSYSVNVQKEVPY